MSAPERASMHLQTVEIADSMPTTTATEAGEGFVISRSRPHGLAWTGDWSDATC
jgi:hypothetical protein